MNNIAIITAVSGLKYGLSTPTVIHSNVDYFAFVDKSYDVKAWNQIIISNFTCDKRFTARRNAKIYKIIPHLYFPNYKFLIWVDSTHDVIKDPEMICEKYLKDNDIAVFKHTERTCCYEEANEIKELNFDNINDIDRQIKFYKEEKMPENFGLFELPVNIRKNTKSIECLNLKWWEQICRFSSRDQVSFPYCLWKLNIKPSIIPGFANGINPSTGKIGNNELIPQVRNNK
jgi:hypothetical protein